MVIGPNGSGKTTLCKSLISYSSIVYEFLNADEIARALAPLHPESVSLTASKLLIKRLKDLLENDKSLAIETTGAGTNYLKYIKDAKLKGYQIDLIFLWLPSPESAIERVAQRVAQGGHFIPNETVIRRFFSGLKNFTQYYLPICDRAIIFDNSLPEEKKIIATKNDLGLKIENNKTWQDIERHTDVTK